MKVIKIICSTILIIILLLIFIIEVMLSSLGSAIWLPICSIIIMILVLILVKKNKTRYFCLTLLIINLLIPTILYIGSQDRNLTVSEKRYILNYLEKKYGDKEFKIKSGKASNEEKIGLQNMFSYYIYDWKNIDGEITDSNGYKFDIIGHNKGFNNIISLTDNYDVISSVYKFNFLFDNKISNVKANIFENYWEQISPPYNYYISLSMNIDSSKDLKKDFNERLGYSYIQNIKQDILRQGYCKDIRIYVEYKMKDGIITYNLLTNNITYNQ